MDNNGNDIQIWRFNRTDKQWHSVGEVTNITSTADLNMGAVYSDPNNNLYMSSNGSGKLWRVNVSGSAPFTAVQLPATEVGSNDGARCAAATVPIDFGDAPSTYGTSITDPSTGGGARHSVANFNPAQSTAPLMLGTHIDIELDGFPSSNADGDDNDHQGDPFVDDERGVTQIIANPGESEPLTVPVRVTNTSGQAATLVGWIDLDKSNTFDPGEKVTAFVENGFTGYKQLAFPAPASPYDANTYARFRIFAADDDSPAATGQLPTGPASDGEVEDVLVQLGKYDVAKTANPVEGSAVDPGATVTYTLTITNTGPGPLSNLKIDDDLTDVLDDATVVGTPSVSPSSAGSAKVDGNTLEFTGDVSTSAPVMVTYSVKIKEAGTLGNASLNNSVLGVHSESCHPQISSDGKATVSDPDCKTNHTVGGLANTGFNIFTLFGLSVGLLTTAGGIWLLGLQQRSVRQYRR